MASEFAQSLMRARFLFGTVPLFAMATTALFPVVALELKRQGLSNSSFYALGAVYAADIGLSRTPSPFLSAQCC